MREWVSLCVCVLEPQLINTGVVVALRGKGMLTERRLTVGVGGGEDHVQAAVGGEASAVLAVAGGKGETTVVLLVAGTGTGT